MGGEGEGRREDRGERMYSAHVSAIEHFMVRGFDAVAIMKKS